MDTEKKIRIKLHTTSRDKTLYYATATYCDGKVTVHPGGRINTAQGDSFKSKNLFESLMDDKKLVDDNGFVLRDITFPSLSAAASFVTGRIANGMIVWKTEDNRYVRYLLNQLEER